MNPLSLLGSGGSIAAVLGLVLTLGGGAYAVVHEHDAKLVAQVAAQQAVVAAQAQHEQDQRTISGMTEAASLRATRLTGAAKIKEAINAVPKSNTCATSPAIVALIGALRSGAGGGNADPAPTAAAHGLAVPSPAPAAR